MKRLLLSALLSSACATTNAAKDDARVDDGSDAKTASAKKSAAEESGRSTGAGLFTPMSVDMKAMTEQAAKQAQAMREAQAACTTEIPDTLTDAQLADLAREREAAFEKNTGPRLDDAAAVKELQRIGLAVTRTPTLRFGLVSSDQPRAFSASDGTVLVTTGLVKKCANEAQLAAVLAHEADHVAKRADEKPRVQALRAQCQASRAMKEAMPQMAAGAQLGMLGMGMMGAMEGLLRGGEDEADAVALNALASAGYDPAEYEALVRAMGDTNQDGVSSEGGAERRAAKLQSTRAGLKLKGNRKPALPKPLATL